MLRHDSPWRKDVEAVVAKDWKTKVSSRAYWWQFYGLVGQDCQCMRLRQMVNRKRVGHDRRWGGMKEVGGSPWRFWKLLWRRERACQGLSATASRDKLLHPKVGSSLLCAGTISWSSMSNLCITYYHTGINRNPLLDNNLRQSNSRGNKTAMSVRVDASQRQPLGPGNNP